VTSRASRFTGRCNELGGITGGMSRPATRPGANDCLRTRRGDCGGKCDCETQKVDAEFARN